MISTPGRTLRTDAVAAAVVVVGAFGRNGQADTLVLTEAEAGLVGQASAAVVPGGAAVRDLDARAVVGAPGKTGVADTASAVVVVVGALLRNEHAVVESRAQAVGG